MSFLRKTSIQVDKIEEQKQAIQTEINTAKSLYGQGKLHKAKSVLVSAKQSIKHFHIMAKSDRHIDEVKSLTNKVENTLEKISHRQARVSDIQRLEIKNTLQILLDQKTMGALPLLDITAGSKVNAAKLHNALIAEVKTITTDDPICIMTRLLILLNNAAQDLSIQEKKSFFNSICVLIPIQLCCLEMRTQQIENETKTAIVSERKNHKKLADLKNELSMCVNFIERAHTIQKAAYAHGVSPTELKLHGRPEGAAIESRAHAGVTVAEQMSAQHQLNIDKLRNLIKIIDHELPRKEHSHGLRIKF